MPCVCAYSRASATCRPMFATLCQYVYLLAATFAPAPIPGSVIDDDDEAVHGSEERPGSERLDAPVGASAAAPTPDVGSPQVREDSAPAAPARGNSAPGSSVVAAMLNCGSGASS